MKKDQLYTKLYLCLKHIYKICVNKQSINLTMDFIILAIINILFKNNDFTNSRAFAKKYSGKLLLLLCNIKLFNYEKAINTLENLEKLSVVQLANIQDELFAFGCTLDLMDNLQKYDKGHCRTGKIYLEKIDNNSFKYVTNIDGIGNKRQEGIFTINTEERLTEEFLNSKKLKILKIMAEQGHFSPCFFIEDLQVMLHELKQLNLINKQQFLNRYLPIKITMKAKVYSFFHITLYIDLEHVNISDDENLEQILHEELNINNDILSKQALLEKFIMLLKNAVGDQNVQSTGMVCVPAASSDTSQLRVVSYIDKDKVNVELSEHILHSICIKIGTITGSFEGIGILQEIIKKLKIQLTQYLYNDTPIDVNSSAATAIQKTTSNAVTAEVATSSAKDCTTGTLNLFDAPPANIYTLLKCEGGLVVEEIIGIFRVIKNITDKINKIDLEQITLEELHQRKDVSYVGRTKYVHHSREYNIGNNTDATIAISSRINTTPRYVAPSSPQTQLQMQIDTMPTLTPLYTLQVQYNTTPVRELELKSQISPKSPKATKSPQRKI